MKAACASADTINVWDVGANGRPGGSLVDPALLITVSEPGVGQAGTNGPWHSAAFTWDGKVLVAGWDPGGGAAAECEATDPDIDKSLFFYDASTGAKLGQWVLPRPLGQLQHRPAPKRPLRGRRPELPGRTWVTDFTDPANPMTLAWSDPESLGPGPFCDPDGSGPLPGQCQLGGAWSSYF